MRDWVVVDSQVVMYAISGHEANRQHRSQALHLINRFDEAIVICPLVSFELLQNTRLDEGELEDRMHFIRRHLSPDYDQASAQFAAAIRQRIRDETSQGNSFAGDRDLGLPEFTMDVQILGYALRWNARYMISNDQRCILKIKEAGLLDEIPIIQQHRPHTEILALDDPGLKPDQPNLFDGDR